MNGNYPQMSQSELEKAPFNEPVLEEKRFEIEASCLLRRDVTVTTDDYVNEYDYEACCHYANTERTDWERAYMYGHYSIPQLLDKLKEYVNKEIKETLEKDGMTQVVRNLKDLLEDCEAWEVVEEEYG